jgi:LysR family transcriptional regulator, glycine cleavage system transcriptional activator
MNLVHNDLMQRLPPFDALIAFDAVARLGSVTRAASEIGITQSAVSHRLRRLQDFMGVVLYERTAEGLVVNPAGLALHVDIGDLLARAAELKPRCASASVPSRLRLGVGAALADNWLARRLPAFTRLRPDISIEVSVLENKEAERTARFDARVLWVGASEARASSTQRPLFREHVFPACAPALLGPGGELGDARRLLTLPLLQKRDPGAQGAEWEWQTWFARLGLDATPRPALSFTTIGPAISAALAGAGIALARTMLVCDALADGRLVRLLPLEHDLLSAKVYILRWPARHVGDPYVRAFADWIAEEAHASAS